MNAELELLIEAREACRSGRGERLRVAADLTKSEVARAVGVTPAAIARWETGERQPRGDGACAYALLLRDLERLSVPA